MKTLLLVFFFFLSLNAYSQSNYSYFLYIEDSKKNVDSILFGISDSSTLGIDTLLGEINKFGIPYDSLEIRSIQRTDTNYHCLTNAKDPVKIYSSENLDLKIDLRPSKPTKPYYEYYAHSLNQNFEIFFHTINYPISIYTDFFGLKHYQMYSYIAIVDDQCSIINVIPLRLIIPSHKTFLCSITDSTINTLIIHLEPDLGSINYNNQLYPILYPNPACNYISIRNRSINNGYVELRNIYGQLLEQMKINNATPITFNLTCYPNGLYNVVLYDLDKGNYYISKFIKQ